MTGPSAGSGRPHGRGDDLRALLQEILDCARELAETYEAAGRRRPLADAEKIVAAGSDLRRRLESLLDGAEPREAGNPADGRKAAAELRHELRTALNAVIGYSEILLEDAGHDEDLTLRKHLRSIRSSATLFQSRIGDVVGLSTAGGAAGDPRPAADPGAPAGSLLVVDDNASNRDLLVRHLQRQGHRVAAAASGQEALDLMRRHAYDMVLLDVRMPGMDGLEVLRTLKSSGAWREIPVVMVSSFEEMDVVVESIQQGAEDYLLKPFNSVLLGARIGACLEKKRLRLRTSAQKQKLAELEEAIELRAWRDESRFVAESSAMQRILSTAHSVSRTPVSVLVSGDSGTGKEAIARLIHRCSDRRDLPFIPVNCASIPETLAESEFFGYEKGAFTGAATARRGRFEEAAGGTLFLDEIGDMPAAIQPKFLRAIQEGEGTRLGSGTPVRYDFRIISATNKDLRREVEEGRFREDLFYRLFAVEIRIPALRERREDIVPLTLSFVRSVGERFGRKVGGCSPEVLSLFEEYPWPGNVRQLIHEVERMVALTPEGTGITLEHASPELRDWRTADGAAATAGGPSGGTLSERLGELERSCLRDALASTGGNKTRAAGILGITRQGLEKKLKRHRI